MSNDHHQRRPLLYFCLHYFFSTSGLKQRNEYSRSYLSNIIAYYYFTNNYFRNIIAQLPSNQCFAIQVCILTIVLTVTVIRTSVSSTEKLATCCWAKSSYLTETSRAYYTFF